VTWDWRFGISDFTGQISERAARLSAFQLHRSLRLALLIVLMVVLAHGNLGAAGATDQTAGTLNAYFDQESAAVGAVIRLTVEYRLPEGGRLPQKLELKGLDDLSILKQIVEPQQIRIQLLVDRLDSLQSEPIGLTYLDSNGQPQVLTADPVALRVVSNLGEKPQEARLHPIRDIIPIQPIWRSYLFWAAAIIALVLLGMAVFWWYSRRRTPTNLPEHMDPPHICARKEIQKLENQRYFEKGMVKTYYFLFSQILRRYLGSIRNFPAAEFTTEEIARRLTTEQDRMLIPLLQQSDLVKFAETVPTPARKEEDIKTALVFIRETSPLVESSPDSECPQETQP